MKVSKSVPYLNKEAYVNKPSVFEIVDLTEKEGKFGRNPEMHVKAQEGEVTGEVFALGLFPANLNPLIDIWGEETNQWKGEKIKLEAREIENTGGSKVKKWILEPVLEEEVA